MRTHTGMPTQEITFTTNFQGFEDFYEKILIFFVRSGMRESAYYSTSHCFIKLHRDFLGVGMKRILSDSFALYSENKVALFQI